MKRVPKTVKKMTGSNADFAGYCALSDTAYYLICLAHHCLRYPDRSALVMGLEDYKAFACTGHELEAYLQGLSWEAFSDEGMRR